MLKSKIDNMNPLLNFKESVQKTLNSDKFTGPLISVFQLQTGVGKTWYQSNELPLVIKDAWLNVEYIIRVSPTKEVAYDGTFSNVEKLSTDEFKFFYVSKDQFTESNLKTFSLMKDKADIICMSITHGAFASNFDWLKTYAPRAVVIFDEAHTFTGLGDFGKEAYGKCHGYKTEYVGSTMDRLYQWMEINPRVIAFTATPTPHQEGDNFFSEKYEICCELASLEDMIPHQAWIRNEVPFHLEKKNADDSSTDIIKLAIDTHFQREYKLETLKEKDSRINTKLSALFHCGNSAALLGVTPQNAMRIVADYLVDEYDFDRETPLLCESTQSGQVVYDLNLNKVKIVDNDDALFEMMMTSEHPLRFLFVKEKCKNGANIYNLTTQVILKVRRPMESRYMIPVQIFGRMVRPNMGTNNLIRTEYMNDIKNYILNYPDDYNVDIDVVLETIVTANSFDIFYATNKKHAYYGDLQPHLETFREYYCNPLENAILWLSQFGDILKPELSEKVEVELIDEEIKCPNCGHVLNSHLLDCYGPLDKFFNIL